jgi:hypothetical protein
VRGLAGLIALVAGCGSVVSPGDEQDMGDGGACDPGLERCGDLCVDTRLDPVHCGACDRTCDLHQAIAGCSDGACVVESCHAGYCDLDGVASTGCETEVDLGVDPSHCGACGRSCSSERCVDGACATRVLVTSFGATTDMGGLAGADLHCQQAADSSDLGGAWLAWLADATGSPATRFQRNEGPYLRLDGLEIAADWEDLTDGALAHPINVTETGGQTLVADAWSNVKVDGTAGPDHCDNWTSTTGPGAGGRGNPNSTTATWTEKSADLACGLITALLFCFEQ